jgi:hypothetical protein
MYSRQRLLPESCAPVSVLRKGRVPAQTCPPSAQRLAGISPKQNKKSEDDKHSCYDREKRKGRYRLERRRWLPLNCRVGVPFAGRRLGPFGDHVIQRLLYQRRSSACRWNEKAEKKKERDTDRKIPHSVLTYFLRDHPDWSRDAEATAHPVGAHE